MLQQINKYLPSITLGFLIIAIYLLLDSRQQQVQIINQVNSHTTQIENHTDHLTDLQSEQAAHQVRITRLELDLCRQKIARMVQCP